MVGTTIREVGYLYKLHAPAALINTQRRRLGLPARRRVADPSIDLVQTVDLLRYGTDVQDPSEAPSLASIEQDADGHAWAVMLAVAKGISTLLRAPWGSTR